jgi:hypothetical protein
MLSIPYFEFSIPVADDSLEVPTFRADFSVRRISLVLRKGRGRREFEYLARLGFDD